MPRRAAVFQKVQIGAEVTPGTNVAASKRLLSTEVILRPREPKDGFRGVGDKFETGETAQKAWSEGRIRGRVSYNDIVYVLSSVLHKAAVAGTWNFKPDSFGPNTPQTYTIQGGSSLGAEAAYYCVFPQMSMRFASQATPDLDGAVFGRRLNEGIAMTASPTNVPKANVSSKHIDVLVGDTIGGLAKITNALEFGLNFGGNWSGFFPLDSAQDSFSDIVERAPDFSASLATEHDTTSAGWMTDLRTSKDKFIRMLANGPVIGAGPATYKLQITMCFEFQEPDRGPRDDIWASMWGLRPVHNDTLGGAIDVQVVNDLVAL